MEKLDYSFTFTGGTGEIEIHDDAYGANREALQMMFDNGTASIEMTSGDEGLAYHNAKHIGRVVIDGDAKKGDVLKDVQITAD